MDSGIQWTNLYPVDIAIGFPKTYTLHSAIQGMNNPGLDLGLESTVVIAAMFLLEPMLLAPCVEIVGMTLTFQVKIGVLSRSSVRSFSTHLKCFNDVKSKAVELPVLYRVNQLIRYLTRDNHLRLREYSHVVRPRV